MRHFTDIPNKMATVSVEGGTTSGNRKLVSEGGLKFSSLQAPEPAADTDCIIVQMSLCFL